MLVLMNDLASCFCDIVASELFTSAIRLLSAEKSKFDIGSSGGGNDIIVLVIEL